MENRQEKLETTDYEFKFGVNSLIGLPTQMYMISQWSSDFLGQKYFIIKHSSGLNMVRINIREQE